MSQGRVAKGNPNQSLLKQTIFSNSLASKKHTKNISGPPKKYKHTPKYKQVIRDHPGSVPRYAQI
jgi:hypothetical protein